MATFNGEKYIREQLDSIYSQTYGNIDVYIRDDGSTDNTLEIVNEYCKKSNSQIKFYIIENNNQNLGYPDCFWDMVNRVPVANYYAFCDQDDYWYPKKIEVAVSELEKVEEFIPAMTYCKFDYCNQSMAFLRHGDSYKVTPNFIQGMYYTFAPGFTQVMNYALIKKINISQILGKNIAHDIWCEWIALSMGIVIQQDEVLAKYRRHESAVTASNKGVLSSIKYWWNSEINGNKMRQWKNSLICYSNQYITDVPKEIKTILLLFSSENYSLSKRIKKVFFPEKMRPTFGGEIALRILFLLGKC